MAPRLKNLPRLALASAVLAVAAAGARANDSSTIGPGLAVVSISGSTAIKNLYTASGNGLFSLEPLNIGTNASPVYQQTSITFSNGTYFSAANANGTLNLAPTTYSTANLGNGSTGPGLLIETHEQGSVEGIYEMAQDQLTQYGYTPPSLATVAPRYPTAANPIHINGSGPAVTTTPSTPNGFTFTANQVQDPVTMAQSDVNHVQGFGVVSGGAAANTAQPWASVPGQNGYGQGNPAFSTNVNNLGAANIAAQMIPNTALTGTVNGVAHNYYNDLQDTVIAKTATTFAANPGTGLTRVNKSDAQFLETASRLANGVVFNFTSRDVNSGTRNVSSLNTGIDPSWSVGKNDTGNGLAANGSDQQTFIGQNLTFSNKTAGGGELRPTVQNSRMAIGTLGQPDVGTRATGASGTLRVLDYGNATSDASITAATNANLPNAVDSNGVVVGTQWSRVSLANIMTGAYTISQNENFVDFQATAANNTAGQTTGILGDDQTPTFAGDTLTLRNMITSSAGLFPSGSFNGPAASMLKTGYVPLIVSAVDRQYDGQTLVANTGAINNTAAFNMNLAWGGAAGTGTVQNPAPDSVLGTSAFNNANFHVDAPGTITAAGDKYGNNTGSNARSGFTGANEFNNVGLITITDTNAGSDATLHQTGNWLVGNFNQTGSRDLAAVETAVFAQQALYASGAGSNLNRVSSLGADAQGNTANGETTRSNASDVSWSGFISSHTAALASAGVSLTALSTMTPQGGAATGADKGDLIIMGDVNGDGRFDGKDLYLLAEGAAVSDAPGTAGYTAGTLTLNSYNATTGAGGFGDAIRTATLRKNTALDFLDQNATQQQKNDAQITFTLSGTGASAPPAPAGATVLTTTGNTITYTYDAAGLDNHSLNAFKKEDVNRDGLIDLNDAIDVDNLAAVPNTDGTPGTHAADYTSLNDQLSDGTILTAGKLRTFNLTDAKLVDGAGTTIGSADLAVMNTALTGAGNTKWFAGTVTKTGPGTILFARSSGAVAIESGAALAITNGQLTADSAVNPFQDNTGGATNGNLLNVAVTTGAILTVGGGVKELGALHLDTSANTIVESGASAATPNVLVTNSLAIGGAPATPAAKLSLSPNTGAVIHSGYTTDQTRQLIQSAYSNGAWTGNGITVATAATAQGIGYATGAEYALLHPTATLGAASVQSTDTVLKYTYIGDANLDGRITISDYTQIDAAFLLQNASPDWFNGDFNYDGVIDYRDYALLDFAASVAGSPLAAAEMAAHAAEFGAPYEAFLQSVAPEPATLTFMSVGVLTLLRRRRTIK